MQLSNRSRENRKPEKQTLDIIAVLAHYGMDASDGYGWKKFRCHGERKPSAVVNSEEGAVCCFSCGLKGDSLSVIMQLDNCSFPDALKKYKEITGVDAPGFGQERSRESHTTASAAESREYEEGSSWLASKLRKGK